MTSKLILPPMLAAVALGFGLLWRSMVPESWYSREVNPIIRLPGVVRQHEVRLGSKIGGRVAESLVAEGDKIVPGQLLIRLEAPELLARRVGTEARLEAALKECLKAKNGPRLEEKEVARAMVEALEARWRLLKAGARPEAIRQARGELKSYRADQLLADRELERANRIVQKNALSRSEFDVFHANKERTSAKVLAAEAQLDLLLAGSRTEDVEAAASELKKARADLNRLLNGTRREDIEIAEARVAEARAALAEINVNLEEANVRSPGFGIVEVLSVRAGDLVSPGQPLLRILRREDLWVEVYVPETDLGKVRLNQPAWLLVDSYPNRSFAGTVIKIAGESEFTPRNVQSADERQHQVFRVKIRVDDHAEIFKSGMAADVLLTVAELP